MVNPPIETVSDDSEPRTAPDPYEIDTCELGLLLEEALSVEDFVGWKRGVAASHCWHLLLESHS